PPHRHPGQRPPRPAPDQPVGRRGSGPPPPHPPPPPQGHPPPPPGGPGPPPPAPRPVDAPGGRPPRDRKGMAVPPAGGRRAVTHWRVLETFPAVQLAEATLETGPTPPARGRRGPLRHT